MLFDNSDAARPDLRQRTFRLRGDDGHIVLQGLVFSDGAREICERIAAGLGLTLDYRGPSLREVATPAAASPSEPVMSTVDTPAAYAVERKPGFLF